jgi:hypothetical protein
VRTGEMACYLYWEKKLHKTSTSFDTPYSYSKQTREVYLYMAGKLNLITNRSSFTALFDQAHRKEIEQYLRKDKINFRKISEEGLSTLFDYCARFDQDQ